MHTHRNSSKTLTQSPSWTDEFKQVLGYLLLAYWVLIFAVAFGSMSNAIAMRFEHPEALLTGVIVSVTAFLAYRLSK